MYAVFVEIAKKKMADNRFDSLGEYEFDGIFQEIVL